jgi:hypothetical protein
LFPFNSTFQALQQIQAGQNRISFTEIKSMLERPGGCRRVNVHLILISRSHKISFSFV